MICQIIKQVAVFVKAFQGSDVSNWVVGIGRREFVCCGDVPSVSVKVLKGSGVAKLPYLVICEGIGSVQCVKVQAP